MCLKPILIKPHDNYKKYRGVLIHRYNEKNPVPCGKCIQCKELKIEEWQIRWTEEMKHSHENSSYFITLTYNDKNIPKKITPDGEEITTLDYTDLTKFFKRLRKRQAKLIKDSNLDFIPRSIKYHACGEYGKQATKRPHFHIMITNLLVPIDEIEKIWGKGLVHIGDNVDGYSVKYILKYALKSSLEKVEKINVYEETIQKIKIEAFPEENQYKPIYKKLKINYHYPTKEETIIIKKRISQHYAINTNNEFRECEKAICSKKIGSDYLTKDIVTMYRKNPWYSYPFYDENEKKIKPKPLPRYYREEIFNPKKRDENGKILYDERKRPVHLWTPLDPKYEDTPRFQKQLIMFKNQQKRLNEMLSTMKIIGTETFMQNYLENKKIKVEEFKRARKKSEIIQKDKIKFAQLENII